jgi:hypothetical protein
LQFCRCKKDKSGCKKNGSHDLASNENRTDWQGVTWTLKPQVKRV